MPALMKGHTWAKKKHTVVYPAYVEVKYDEVRCHVTVLDGKTSFVSYAGKPLFNLGTFAEQFALLTTEIGIKEFDCGVLVNGNFADTLRWVKTKKGIPVGLEDAKLVFILFDMPEVIDLEYEQRLQVRHRVVVNAIELKLPMVQPDIYLVDSEAQVDEAYTAAKRAGYEGLMVKTRDHLYEPGKRTNGWLKVKPSEEGDGVIEELIEAVSLDGVPLGRTGSIRLKVLEDDGTTSYATPHGIPHELGEDMHNNPQKYIGEWSTFDYMERDRQGGYRHPTFGRIREAKA